MNASQRTQLQVMTARLSVPKTWPERIEEALRLGPSPVGELVWVLVPEDRNKRMKARSAIRALVSAGRARMRPMFDSGRVTRFDRAEPLIVVELVDAQEVQA